MYYDQFSLNQEPKELGDVEDVDADDAAGGAVLDEEEEDLEDEDEDA